MPIGISSKRPRADELASRSRGYSRLMGLVVGHRPHARSDRANTRMGGADGDTHHFCVCAFRVGRARLRDASGNGTSLDVARLLWYLRLMIRLVRIVNRKHMTRFGWAVEGVAR